jgi:hypothetical protein
MAHAELAARKKGVSEKARFVCHGSASAGERASARHPKKRCHPERREGSLSDRNEVEGPQMTAFLLKRLLEHNLHPPT